MATLVVTGRRDGKPDRVFITRNVPKGRFDGVRVRITMQDDLGRLLSFDVEASTIDDRVRGSCIVRDEHGDFVKGNLSTIDGELVADTKTVAP